MSNFIKGVKKFIRHILSFWEVEKKYPYIDKTATVHETAEVLNPKNLIMGEHSGIKGGAYIMNTRAKFIMKKYSGAAFGLTVITGGHMYPPGVFYRQITDKMKDELDVNKEEDIDIVVDEDVWIGARTILLRGTHLGRGCIVGAGSVVRGAVPPYAIAIGNPAKVVGFKFTPKEMREHEEKLFSEEERIPMEILQKNYETYYLKRIKEIRDFNKL